MKSLFYCLYGGSRGQSEGEAIRGETIRGGAIKGEEIKEETIRGEVIEEPSPDCPSCVLLTTIRAFGECPWSWSPWSRRRGAVEEERMERSK